MVAEKTVEKRRGKTGTWTFVLETPEGKVLATAEWGRNYLFAKEQWESLPILFVSEVSNLTEEQWEHLAKLRKEGSY